MANKCVCVCVCVCMYLCMCVCACACVYHFMNGEQVSVHLHTFMLDVFNVQV
jgi:hypothetical protein